MNTLGYDAITEEARKTIKIYMNFARAYEHKSLKQENISAAFGAFKLWSNLTALTGDQKEADRLMLQALISDF